MHWYNQPHFNLVIRKDSMQKCYLKYGNIRVKIVSVWLSITYYEAH